MQNAKLDNTLNLSLSLSEQERNQTEDLSIGFDEESNTWELIVNYAGNLDAIRTELGTQVTELSGGYAILQIEEDRIEELTAYEQIIFVEQPRRLFFALDEAVSASCIPPVQARGLTGQGTLIAVLDSGIDYAHPDFRNADGSTRIVSLWDQTISAGPPPTGFVQGTEYTAEQINTALQLTNAPERFALLPSTDLSGHGTHVAGICAGNGRASQGRYIGVAPECNLIIVKLGTSVNDSFPRTTQLMTALEYSLRTAIRLRRPLAINISFGNQYGAHNGFSLLEDYINIVASQWKVNIVIGTGNEGTAGRHAQGNLGSTLRPERDIRSGLRSDGADNIRSSGTPTGRTPDSSAETIVELAVGEAQSNFSLQIWKHYFDDVQISLRAPSGTRIGPIPPILGNQTFLADNTKILLYYGEPVPQNPLQEIYFEFIPGDTFAPYTGTPPTISDTGRSFQNPDAGFSRSFYADSGIWQIILTPRRIISGEYHMWLPSGSVLAPRTAFLSPSEETTLTVPSTARRAISVGAYDVGLDTPLYFSGRGYTTAGLIKPDLLAPGSGITAAAVGGGYTTMSGTSMAAPFVTGSAALLMQWGILFENDPYLYGEKLKAYLISGARPLAGYPIIPDPVTGYGALCLENAFP